MKISRGLAMKSPFHTRGMMVPYGKESGPEGIHDDK
jgi:hypothetical protein